MDNEEDPQGKQLRKMKEMNGLLEQHLNRTLSEFKQANDSIIQQQHNEEEDSDTATVLQNYKKLQEKLTEIQDEVWEIRQELGKDEQRHSGFHELIQQIKCSLSTESQSVPTASCSHCCAF